MYVQKHTVTLTTAADGSATGYTPVVTGLLDRIVYTKTDFANGHDPVITIESTGEILLDEDNLDASATRAPRQATHSTAGVASLYAAAGTAVQDKISLCNDRIKVVIANGGDTKTGAYTFYII